MSRNFELMQSLGRGQEIFETAADANTVVAEPAGPAKIPPAPLDFQSLLSKMEPAQRNEVLNLLQRIFLVPGTGRDA